jgi:hypothetical protein
MKPELQEKIYTWITEAAQKVGDWSSTEIPLFVTEYLQWKFVEAAMYTVVWAIGVAIASLFIPSLKRWCFDKQVRKESDDISILIFVIVAMIFIMITITSSPYDEIRDMLQIHIAPKVYLLEKASELLKK